MAAPALVEPSAPRLSAVAFLLQATPWTALDVRRGSLADVSVRTRGPADERLVWQFELEEHDVGFQLLEDGAPRREPARVRAASDGAKLGDVARELLESPSSSGDADSANNGPQTPWVEDSLAPLRLGSTYTFRWDNSYSLVRHKRLRYRFLLTSARAFEAAQVAACEASARFAAERSQTRSSARNAVVARPHAARELARQRELQAAAAAAEQRDAIEALKQGVADVVASFVAKPDSPLHEGSVRAFVLALEAVLRHGVKESCLDVWPEEPYYAFLLETGAVLRDDGGLVAQVTSLVPPETLQYLGWGRARAFLFLALNKKLLHRAFENLVKRRMLVERYYDPHALLFDYTNATQCAPEAPLRGQETLQFSKEIDADSAVTRGVAADPDRIKVLQDCSLPRYLLHEQPFEDFHIGRGSVVHAPLALQANRPVLVIQLQVLVQDISVSISYDDKCELAKPVLVSASDLWTEGVFRVKTKFKPRLSIKLDNAYSFVRAKQVRLRYRVATELEYALAWEACLEMAQAMTWKRVARVGADRCAAFMDSLRVQEEEELEKQRKRDAAAVRSDQQTTDANSILGIPTSLISNPVSYLVGGMLSSEPSSCAQCMAPFSFFSRQHQCPGCRSVVCIPCSRHSVQLNGSGPQVKTCDRCFLKAKDLERKRNAGLSGQTQQQGECAEFAALRRDPAMDKYFKMLSFGVPASGVVQKMMQDNVDSETVRVFSAGPSGPDTSVPSLSSSVFRKVHWTSLETKKASESIWTRVTARRKAAPITLSPQDFQALESLFGGKSSNTTSAQSKETRTGGGGGGGKKFTALDSRRSNNISIGLSQFKALGGVEAIVASLKACDFAFLTAERLATLCEVAPTAVEAKRYTDFRGSRAQLEASERFLVEMCGIPRMAAMLFVVQFEHQQQELRDRIRTIARACDEILHSERLARCFELVLAIGNLLNAGTELEDARGVTLASLLKLSETKSMDRTTTLLQFIVKLVHDRGEGDILHFVDDLGSLADAKRTSNVICVSQFRALQSGISQVEAEITEEMVPTNDGALSSASSAKFVPHEYTMNSKFIVDMRQRLLDIKAAYEDVELELEAMTAAWEATARYLGEDPSSSSSEYTFNLLNRFRLDVKVVKSLLFRKGLNFANDLQTLLPNTPVGSTIATIYGPGVVTALRVADKRVEVKFPWSREAYLSPSCILSAGTLVRCRWFGVGLIRETSFSTGCCCVRFAFGYGMIHVRDLGPETSSNAGALRAALLRTNFYRSSVRDALDPDGVVE
ncbi:hypothetical protein PybrP1_008146 [[Pythium] brassicae (nom. inval.)]|nr:hypothetical protein PybrP1_008146 [[Pythium] brassicae (nom. inval.)]